MGHEGRGGWGEHLAHQRQDSQSGHLLVARFPQLEHAWRSSKEWTFAMSKEGDIRDEWTFESFRKKALLLVCDLGQQ